MSGKSTLVTVSNIKTGEAIRTTKEQARRLVHLSMTHKYATKRERKKQCDQ